MKKNGLGLVIIILGLLFFGPLVKIFSRVGFTWDTIFLLFISIILIIGGFGIFLQKKWAYYCIIVSITIYWIIFLLFLVYNWSSEGVGYLLFFGGLPGVIGIFTLAGLLNGLHKLNNTKK